MPDWSKYPKKVQQAGTSNTHGLRSVFSDKWFRRKIVNKEKLLVDSKSDERAGKSRAYIDLAVTTIATCIATRFVVHKLLFSIVSKYSELMCSFRRKTKDCYHYSSHIFFPCSSLAILHLAKLLLNAVRTTALQISRAPYVKPEPRPGPVTVYHTVICEQTGFDHAL